MDDLLVGTMCTANESNSMLAVVETKVIMQAQHISNRKYNNFYTVNAECRQTVVCIDIAI
jgi:hypothetical protein